MVEKDNKEIVSVKITAELESLTQIEKIFNDVTEGNTIQLCGGNAELKLLTVGDTLSFSGGSTVELLVSFSIGVASGVVGNFIYDVICKGIKKLEINGRRTRIKEENITQTIETIKDQVSSDKEYSSNENSNDSE